MKKSIQKNPRYHAIHARLTEEELKDFSDRLASTELTQSDYIRQAVFHSEIKFTILKECNVDQLEKLIGEYGKIGSNLNQIAKHLNEDGATTKHIVDEVRNAALDLADLKYEILKIVGDTYGNMVLVYKNGHEMLNTL